MDAVINAVITVLGSIAVKSLFTSTAPDANDMASATTKILQALIQTQDQTKQQLARIEERLDQLGRDRYQQPFREAMAFLESATVQWRSTEDRARDLTQARYRLVAAVSAAPDGLSAALLEWHLAVVWLLLRSPEDCDHALQSSAARSMRTLRAMLHLMSLQDYQLEDRTQYMTTLDRIVDRSPAAWSAAADKKLEQASITARAAIELVAGAQVTRRRIFDMPMGRALIPRVVPSLPDGKVVNRQPRMVVVDLEDGTNSVEGLEIAVHAAVVHEPTASRSFHVLDVELELAPGPEAGATTVLAIDPIHTMSQLPDFEAFRPDVITRVPLEMPLPGPTILQSGQGQSAMRELTIAPGIHARGWLRLACDPWESASDSAHQVQGVRFFRPSDEYLADVRQRNADDLQLRLEAYRAKHPERTSTFAGLEYLRMRMDEAFAGRSETTRLVDGTRYDGLNMVARLEPTS